MILSMAILKAYHYYIRKNEYDKCSLGIKEILPIEDRCVSDVFAVQYDYITENEIQK